MLLSRVESAEVAPEVRGARSKRLGVVGFQLAEKDPSPSDSAESIVCHAPPGALRCTSTCACEAPALPRIVTDLPRSTDFPELALGEDTFGWVGTLTPPPDAAAVAGRASSTVAAATARDLARV